MSLEKQLCKSPSVQQPRSGQKIKNKLKIEITPRIFHLVRFYIVMGRKEEREIKNKKFKATLSR
jgi:hypothetical protein